jgi:hypothetical protein
VRVVLLLSSSLLCACLSAPEPAGTGDPGDAGSDDCERIPLSEDFADEDWQSARWATSHEDVPGMLRAEDERAVIVPSGDADVYAWFGTTAEFDFADRCVSVDVPSTLINNEGEDAETLLNLNFGAYEVSMGQSGSALCCQLDLDGDFLIERCEATYSSEAHARWRLRFEAGEAICDTAPAEGAWTEYHRFAYDGPLTGTVELMAGTWGDVAEPGQVAFDNINK